MQRVIKFRVWNIKDKEWDNPAILEVWDRSGDFRPLYEPRENYIIQQFIGLTDRNGKEIYEGDILELCFDAMGIRDENGNPQFIIGTGHEEWFERKKNVIVKYEFNENSVFIDLESHLDTICPNKKSLTYQVIGNIFENPELIKNA